MVSPRAAGPSSFPLLDRDNVGEYLVGRGLLPSGTAPEVRELSGGVSCVVLGVAGGGKRLVVKQALGRLRVADEWLAKPERAVTEGQALALARSSQPDAFPAVLDVDAERCVVTIEWAPEEWRVWKADLLVGRADASVAETVGVVLATLHGKTWGSADAARRFGDYEAFDQLRVEPFYRTVMNRLPPIAEEVAHHARMMSERRLCLVHGDYSPKNVLVGPGRIWVIDFEVAHYGDPAFDLAYMLNHLMLKAIHSPRHVDWYRSCAARFWESYRATGPETVPDASYVVGHVGCLMAARVVGKSPAEYLSDAERSIALDIASELVKRPGSSDDAWDLLSRAVRA